jgi:hypothetical protein
MKRFCTIILCCGICACGRDAEPPEHPIENRTSDAVPQLSGLEQRAKAEFDERVAEADKAKRMLTTVTKAMETYLFDPGSAQYRQVRAGRAGAICGKYNAKNRLGAYVGFKDFVVSKDRENVFFSQHNDGVRSELYGSFAEAYLNVCANSEEKKRHAAASAPPAYLDDVPSDPFSDI